MRVIIPGGTGFIGRPLAERLAQAGHDVVVLSRRPEAVGGLPQGVRAVGWDARTADGWGRLADGAGAIVNLAGENIGASSWTDERKQRIRQSRKDAGQAVVEAVQAATQKPEVVIQSSGTGYYGVHEDEILDESAPRGSDFLADVARDWEGSTAAVEELGVRRVVTRSGMVLGRGEGALPRLVLPFRFFAGGPLGSGRQWYSWIHLTDEVRAIAYLIENRAAQGVYNLTAPNPVTSRDMAHALGKVLGRPSFVPAPGPALRLALGEMATLVLDGQRVLPRCLLELGFRFDFPNVEGALRDLLK